ncbi:myo-inositol 2-dehydrogenase/D-chiro-inositol 1-dehydrogenase [Asanoa ferruginea]|uniref:Myo-inositol 2-dehydrogenase/D-chiro-inositol 1-dehydrogenase n=1 Tax=Asanoa ferruginea TaxID=53367 RepID=A0A3D9ZUC9_9ACTN|nr:Gfo/Idh/MocA family oxidoreductase [Asanoa ferruginea]REG00786.1 myo-inositol 2-dehydrogenase/D-chiro-inositol 1-dehydrogenase [Asanoa ferruginea]GIF47340.1 oxidoreductase [Asanoa ferruginea]
MTVNIAVVGTGRIARVHAEAYKHVSGGRLTTCTDPINTAAEAFATDYGLTIAPDLDAILADDTVDAVLLASPNAVHADQTIAALKAGKHVFCQKPISLTLADADRVVEAAANSDRILQHGFMLRFTPPLPGLKQRIASGELGEPIASRAAVFGWEPTNDWFYDPAQGGGVILDTLVHFGDLVQWLFGPATTVYTAGGAYVLEGAKRHRSPDNATVTVTHDTGVVTSMYVTWTAGHGNFTIEAYGSAGEAAVDLVQAQAMRTFDKTTGWGYPDLLWDYGYQGEQQYFVDRIAGRVDGSQAATPRQARDALSLVLAAQRSLDEGTAVKP